MRAFPQIKAEKRYFLSAGQLRIFVFYPNQPLCVTFWRNNGSRIITCPGFTLDQMNDFLCGSFPRGRELTKQQTHELMGDNFKYIP